MPLFVGKGFQNQKSPRKRINTSPTSAEVKSAKDLGMDLGKRWNAYSNEVRLHIYVSDMEEMVRFYNQILEFPVVRYWRYSDGDGTQIDLGGNLIELFTKGRVLKLKDPKPKPIDFIKNLLFL